MGNEKIKQIEFLLRKNGVLEEELNKRLKIINILENTVLNLKCDISEFRGIEIYGSILNERFNNSSDIDINFLFCDYYPIELRDMKWINGKIYIDYIKDKLGEETKYIIHDNRSLDGKKIKEEFDYKDGVLGALIIPFGIFFGDENYRYNTAKEILNRIKENRKNIGWTKIRKKFNQWGHKDLTNPEEKYRLSNFEKLVSDYNLS